MKSEGNNNGYVYILTNPSFREDWVKIGKSSREVDVRSKELDNTAVPLPFEIFATLKTVKYNEVEKNLHKIFTDLADARIRKGREFFNITPRKALDYLEDQAEIIDDAELNIPDDEIEKTDRKKTVHKGKYKVNTDEIFKFAKDTTDARMKVVDGNKYIVLAGSKIDLNIYSNKNTVKKLREENVDKLDEETTIADIEFSSPSTAGGFVGGGAANGKYYWRTAKNDKKLADFIEYIK
ncbi:MAG: GIY-YIG nuclease family protein [Patescibacteria group bacterium]|nr:GIY-YIG nuclease family protein [Patescibacteria group bacterium]